MCIRDRFTPRPALAAAAALVLLAGCATGPDANPKDPLEPFNRGVYRFNDAVDTAVLKPVATAYVDITPSPVRTGVNNFFGNLGDLWSAVNAGLQLRPRETADNLLRFGVNTVLGFGGLLDIASEAGIERTRIDFGQTLGRWGVPSGAYLVLPFFGPSTVRDTGGLVADSAADPVGHVDHIPSRNSLYALRVVDTRAGLLRAGELFNDAALDPYSFMRDFYLNRRQRQIDDMIDKGIGLGDGDDAE
ncbi:VacJ family lipoprotein [uncultured Hydrogenophaga sp.]|uniref:MlaA family lipoprotein n=1 Tax=uncultured Hydrogenophaga sp. TaxID=199683 RepID=UPI002582961B|nr:VacJ family lipoprotein [uncultured Hydrogenophaga sp.]